MVLFCKPRVCGEKAFPSLPLGRMLGSPPRMRGKAIICLVQGNMDGITPAYAGKSTYSSFHPAACKDHPRACGEKSSGGQSISTMCGSPPRMRGKADDNKISVAVRRITPAYAGKSIRSWITAQWKQDHPRVCGEKLRIFAMLV